MHYEGDFEGDESCSQSTTDSSVEVPLQFLPKLDTAFIARSSSGTCSSLSSTNSNNDYYCCYQDEKKMLRPGAIIKGPWTREVSN